MTVRGSSHGGTLPLAGETNVSVELTLYAADYFHFPRFLEVIGGRYEW